MSVTVEAFKLEDYKIHVQALTNQYGRMWTRFNFFITIHTALMVALIGLFKDDGASWSALPIPALGALMSVLWYITGAQDRYLVVFYRLMITHAAERVGHDTGWAHPGLHVTDAAQIMADATLPADDRPAADPERVLRLQQGWFQRRWEKISVTKLPALTPVVIGTLWLGAGIGLALAA